jgi:hypothetical protein
MSAVRTIHYMLALAHADDKPRERGPAIKFIPQLLGGLALPKTNPLPSVSLSEQPKQTWRAFSAVIDTLKRV